jgi:hypothetical protein
MGVQEDTRRGRALPLLLAGFLFWTTACEAAGDPQASVGPSVDSTLDAIVLARTAPPRETRFLRELDGAIAATRLVQDGGPSAQVAVQEGLVDSLTREFGSVGVRAVRLDGAPTEELDPTDVAVDSSASAYGDAASAGTALEVLLNTTRQRLERERDLRLGDGGSIFRGRFLRGMPLVTYIWRSGRFILHVLAVGAFDEGEIRSIAEGMDERAG